MNEVSVSIKILLVVFLFVWSAGCGKENLSESRMLENANKYLVGGKYKNAVIELKNVLLKNPAQGEVRYKLGQIYLQAGDFSAAAKEFRKAYQTDWNKGQAQTALAETLLIGGDHKRLLRNISIEDSFSEDARANLLAIKAAAMAQSDRQQAGELLKKSEAIRADAFHVLRAKAGFQMQDGATDSALKTLDVALKKYPNTPELLLWTAQGQLQMGDKSAAESSYNSLIENEPKDIVTLYGRLARLELGRLLIMDNRRYQVGAIIRPVTKQNPDDIEANYLSAVIALKDSDLKNAEILLRKILAVRPTHIPSHLLLGSLMYEQKKYEQAVFHLQKFNSADTGNPGAQKLLVRTYLKLGQNKKARALLQRIPANKNNNAELLALIGLSELQLGNESSGISIFKQALELSPNDKNLRQDLATAFVRLGGNDEAIDELQKLARKADKDSRAERLLVLAYIRSKEFDKALDQAKIIFERHPESPAALSLVGNVYYEKGDLDTARIKLSEAIEKHPEYLQASILLAQLELRAENPDRAREIYIASTRSSPQSVQPLLALALLSELEDDLEGMRDWLEKARKLDAGDIKSRLALAKYYLSVNQTEAADQVLGEAENIDPLKNDLLLLRTRFLISQGHYEKALKPLTQILAVSPDTPNANLLLAELQIELTRLDEARSTVLALLDKYPQSARALLLAADIEMRGGLFDEALKWLKQLKHSVGNSSEASELEARAYMGKGDFTIAREILDKLVKDEPNSNRVILLAEAISYRGDKSAALELLSGWIKSNPMDRAMYGHIGMLHQRFGDNKEAIISYEKVLETEPDNKVVLNNLAWLMYLEGDSRGLQFVKRAYRLDPNDPGILDTYGWLLVVDGQIANGKILLQKAIQKLPDVPEVRYHYAMAEYKAGEKDKALLLLTDLMKETTEFEGRDAAKRLLDASQ